VTPSGSSTDLGDPFKQTVFGFIANSRGYLADAGCVVTDDNCSRAYNGSLRWFSYAQPGRPTTLLRPSRIRRIWCAPPMNGLAACATRGFGHRRTGTMRLMPLNGASPTTTTTHCPYAAPAILEHSAAWIIRSGQGCPAGHLEVLSPTGTVTSSTRTFSHQPVIAALGRIIVRTTSGRSLESLTSANATPRVVLTA
jgi:hypothetical protein